MTASKTTPPVLYTVAEIAHLLKVSTKKVRRWIKDGDLIAHRFGHQFRITESDLAVFIRQRRQA